jgi:hypothetical protein
MWRKMSIYVHSSLCIKINKVGKQEVGISLWWVQKRFPRYGVPIWSLWPNIKFLLSIVAEKNVTKNEHICSLCIKINKVGKQEVGFWRFKKRFPRYGVPIWSLWPNIRFLPSIVTEKNVTKNKHIYSLCIKINKDVKQEEENNPWVPNRKTILQMNCILLLECSLYGSLQNVWFLYPRSRRGRGLYCFTSVRSS